MDSLNTLSIVTYNIDRKRGTGYYQRFLDSLHYVQEGDLTCDGAMTDPKGDRSLPPHQRHDPDRYLRVVEEREDGIVVRGAKAHQTGALWPLLANVHKHNVTRYPYEIARLAQDVAGGLMVTMPSEADFNSVDTAKWLEKNLGTNPGVSTMNRMRILRLIENPTLGSREVGYLTKSMHGAGSSQAQRIMISRQVNMEEKKRSAKNLCGVDESGESW